VGLERDPLGLVNTIKELLRRKSNGSGLESREYGRRNPSRWPGGTLYPQKLALTSTSGCRSVGIVRSRTQATEFMCSLFCAQHICVFLWSLRAVVVSLEISFRHKVALPYTRTCTRIRVIWSHFVIQPKYCFYFLFFSAAVGNLDGIQPCVEIDRISVNDRNMYHSIVRIGHLTAVPF
jgi:hypothetical protein